MATVEEQWLFEYIGRLSWELHLMTRRQAEQAAPPEPEPEPDGGKH